MFCSQRQDGAEAALLFLRMVLRNVGNAVVQEGVLKTLSHVHQVGIGLGPGGRCIHLV